MKQAVIVAFALNLAAASAVAQTAAKGGDEEFTRKASEAGMAEVEAGKLAVKSASSDAVRKFAQQMIDDHTKANKELMTLAKKKGLPLAKDVSEEHRKECDKLKGLSGAAFDSAYMAGQVKDHEEAVALFEKQSKNGSDEELKTWAKDKLPTLREHLEMARKMADRKAGDKR